MLEEAFYQASSGTPGPVFVEFPADTLYNKPWLDEAMGKMLPPAKGFVANAAKWYFDVCGVIVFLMLVRGTRMQYLRVWRSPFRYIIQESRIFLATLIRSCRLSWPS